MLFLQQLNGFGQVFFLEGTGVDGKNIVAQSAHLNAGKAEVLGHGINVRPVKIRAAQSGKCQFHYGGPPLFMMQRGL